MLARPTTGSRRGRSQSHTPRAEFPGNFPELPPVDASVVVLQPSALMSGGVLRRPTGHGTRALPLSTRKPRPSPCLAVQPGATTESSHQEVEQCVWGRTSHPPTVQAVHPLDAPNPPSGLECPRHTSGL